MSSIYLPGRGMVNLAARRVDSAVREYDERLFFATNPQTGQWTVFVKIERDVPDDVGTSIAGTRAFPIMAFQDVPEPGYVTRRLYETDSLRNGTRMLDEMHRHNNAIRAEQKARADEAAGILAEAQESYARNNGKTSYSRSLRPIHRSAIKRP